MRNKLMVAFIGLLGLLVLAAPAASQDLPDWVSRLKVSGLAFGDYYNVAAHHDEDLEGMNGFWFRRIYLTFDFKVDDNVDSRLRFEGSSPGNFTSSNKIQDKSFFCLLFGFLL